ncbi:MAG: hypothetical protein IKO86_01290 [Prevotella sp.]|nr:hypothetical protein [Prevotella sp.]
MRKYIIACLILCSAITAEAQYIPAFQKDAIIRKDPGMSYWTKGNSFKHLELSLTLGTSGVGLDVAVPVSQIVQVRIGYDYMPQFKKQLRMNLAGGGEAARQYNGQGNRIKTKFDKIQQYLYEETGMEIDDHILLTGQLSMHNLKALVDVYPFKYNKHWHFTAGVYYGPAQVAKAEVADESVTTLSLMESYNREYEEASSSDAIKSYGRLSLYPGDKNRKPCLVDPADDGSVNISVKTNAVKPYLGVGYTGRLISSRDDWKVSAELGVWIWGGAPKQRMHDGTSLPDLSNIPGALGDYVKVINYLKVYPVLNVRFAKTFF